MWQWPDFSDTKVDEMDYYEKTTKQVTVITWQYTNNYIHVNCIEMWLVTIVQYICILLVQLLILNGIYYFLYSTLVVFLVQELNQNIYNI